MLTVDVDVVFIATRLSLQSSVNKMSPSNIGVVFGPTLMRPETEGPNQIANINIQNFIGGSYHAVELV